MISLRLPAILLIGTFVLASCGTIIIHREDSGHDTPGHHKDDPGHHPHIPPGHLPPPGECRIWYPDRPAGHQPPPGSCSELKHQVPKGAWFISREYGDKKTCRVHVYDRHKPGVVIVIRIYNVETGIYISDAD